MIPVIGAIAAASDAFRDEEALFAASKARFRLEGSGAARQGRLFEERLKAAL
jgi:hypothetical protein